MMDCAYSFVFKQSQTYARAHTNAHTLRTYTTHIRHIHTVYTCTHTHARTHTHTHTHTLTHTHIHSHKLTLHTHTHSRAYTHTHAHTRMCTFAHESHSWMCTSTFYAWVSGTFLCALMRVCLCVCVWVCLCVHVVACICVCASVRSVCHRLKTTELIETKLIGSNIWIMYIKLQFCSYALASSNETGDQYNK